MLFSKININKLFFIQATDLFKLVSIFPLMKVYICHFLREVVGIYDSIVFLRISPFVFSELPILSSNPKHNLYEAFLFVFNFHAFKDVQGCLSSFYMYQCYEKRGA